MVSTTPARVPTVAQLHTHLIATKRRWLTTYPHLTANFAALADLVSEILTVHLAAARAVNDELVHEIVVLEAELAAARAERDDSARESDRREQDIIALTAELGMVRDERDAFGRALANKGVRLVYAADLDTPGGEA